MAIKPLEQAQQTLQKARVEEQADVKVQSDELAELKAQLAERDKALADALKANKERDEYEAKVQKLTSTLGSRQHAIVVIKRQALADAQEAKFHARDKRVRKLVAEKKIPYSEASYLVEQEDLATK